MALCFPQAYRCLTRKGSSVRGNPESVNAKSMAAHRSDQELQAAASAPQSSPLSVSPLMQAGSGRQYRPVLKLETAPNDLAEHKRRLLQKNGVCVEHNLPLQRAVDALKAARIISLSKVDCQMSAARCFSSTSCHSPYKRHRMHTGRIVQPANG